jgi:hypothetical protein
MTGRAMDCSTRTPLPNQLYVKGNHKSVLYRTELTLAPRSLCNLTAAINSCDLTHSEEPSIQELRLSEHTAGWPRFSLPSRRNRMAAQDHSHRSTRSFNTGSAGAPPLVFTVGRSQRFRRAEVSPSFDRQTARAAAPPQTRHRARRSECQWCGNAGRPRRLGR